MTPSPETDAKGPDRPAPTSGAARLDRPAARLSYQPALDGLRAVAVLGVMVFHAGVEQLAGGFLGVDLFFGLSGFLITTLILREWYATGTVSLRDFYVRRVRRLYPAMLLTLSLVAIYAQLGGPATTRHSVRMDALSSLFYVSNWRFILNSQSYFEATLGISPLRHLWSLAIEEQWYLISPAVLLVGLRRWGRRPRLLAVIAALGAAFALGWMYLLVPPGADPSRAYYGTESHSFGLLAGAALAIFRHHRPLRTADRRDGSTLLHEVAGTAGLLAVAWMFVVVRGEDEWLYRGGYVIFTIAMLAVIDAAMLPSGRLARILGVRPLAWIGRISYGLYLAHWPVNIAINGDRYYTWHPAVLFAVRFGLAFALATVSYRYVERPIRTARWDRLRMPRLATAGAAAVGSTLVLLLLVSVLRGPASDDAIPWDGPGAGHRARLDAPIPVVPGNLRVLLIGDSVGLTQGTAVNTPGVTMINAARAGCGLVPYTSSRTTGTLGWNGQPGGCAGIAADWEAGLAQKPDVVVLVAGAWEVYDRRIGTTTYRVYQDHYAQLIHERLDDIRAFFSKRADVPLVIEDVPCMRPTNADVGASDNRADDRRTAWVNSVFASYASRHPGGVAVLHVSDFTCPDGEFKRSVDGNVIRYDGVHYDPKVTSRLWATLLPRLLKLPGVTVHHPLDAEPSPSD